MLIYLYNHKVDEIEEDLPYLDKKENYGYSWEYGGCKSVITMMHYCEHCNSTLIGHWEYVDKYVRAETVWRKYTREEYEGKELTSKIDYKIRYQRNEDYKRFHNYGGIRIEPNEKYLIYKENIDNISDFFFDLSYEDKDDLIKFEINKERKSKLEPVLKVAPKIVQYRKEIDCFFSMDTCPICNSNFEKSKNKHVFFSGESFCSDYKLYENLCKIFPKNKFESHKQFTTVNASEINEKISNQQKNSTFDYEQKLVIEYEIRKNGDAYLRHFDKGSIDSKLSYFKHFSESKLDDLANSLIEATIEKYDIKPVEKSLNKSTFGLEGLKNYLNHICQLETNIFALSERLKFLYRIHLESEKDAEASLYLLTFGLKNQLKEAQKAYTELEKCTPEKTISIEKFAFTYPKEPTAPTPPEKPALKTPGLFNKKKINAENNLLTEEYQTKLVAYNEEFKQYSEELERYNAKVEELKQKQNELYSAKLAEVSKEKQNKLDCLNKEILELENKINEIESNHSDIVTKEKIKNELVESEIKEAEKTLSETYNALNELYSYGVIFGKYRNFVAVSTFYEYLVSGRCSTLDGADGAYNIYESEIRSNQIISQLSQVITSLDKIQQNQYVVYSAIQDSNRSLAQLNNSMNSAVSSLNDIKMTTDNMNNTMKKIAENTAVTAYNSSVTAFYSKKNAELANALGYMVALK